MGTISFTHHTHFTHYTHYSHLSLCSFIFFSYLCPMEHRFCDIHTHHPSVDRLSPTMAGVHPWDTERGLTLPDFSTADMVGETGLDFARDIDRKAQEELFRKHLAVAEQLQKPVVIHSVKAFEEVMRILDDYDLSGVLIHGFIGSKEQAERAFKRGYFLSFGTRSLRSPRTVEVIRQAPIEQLFLESDDDKECDIEALYQAVAELRQTTTDELRKALITNYKRLIR